jgi:hypothetical protein
VPKFAVPILILVVLTCLAGPVIGGSYNPRLDLISSGDRLLSGVIRDTGDPGAWFGDIYTYSDIHTMIADPDAQGLALNHAMGPGSLFGGASRGESSPGGGGQAWWELVLGCGYGMADLNLGLMLKYRELKSDDRVPGPHADMATMGFGVDLYPRDSWNVDLALEYRRLQFHDLVAGGEATGISIRARGFHSWRDLVTLVPLVEYSREDRAEIDASSAENIGLGLGFDYQPFGPLHLFLGLGGRSLSLDFTFAPGDTLPSGAELTDRQERYTCFPVVMLGGEYELKGALLRLGISRSWLTTSGDIGGTVTPDHWNLQLGIGLALDQFQVDLALNPDWLYDFGYWRGDRSRLPRTTMDLLPENGESPYGVPGQAGDAPVLGLQVKYYR